MVNVLFEFFKVYLQFYSQLHQILGRDLINRTTNNFKINPLINYGGWILQEVSRRFTLDIL